MKLNVLTGKRAHIWQRISAFYLLLYLPFLAWTAYSLPPHENLKALMETLLHPTYLLTSLLAISLTWLHSWIGLRDILIDYTPGSRTARWLEGLRWLLIALLINLIIVIGAHLIFTGNG